MLGIPAFKLRSNDRWLVTARDIDEALAATTSLQPIGELHMLCS
jgi:hypothetical protein